MRVTATLVRNGRDAYLDGRPVPPPPPLQGPRPKPKHTFENVYGEMLLQICMNYRSLPDPRTLTLGEIRFFYDGLRGELREMTKPKAPKKK